MAIARWTPFSELEGIERRVRRVLEDVGFAPALVPAADVYETEDELVVELEVPGYAEEELSIEVDDRVLVVRGEQARAVDEERRAYRLRERLERSFERRFPLPADVDPASVAAAFGGGVLELRATRRRGERPRTIPIEARES